MGTRNRSLSLPPTLANVPVGRHFVRDLLLEWGYPTAVDDASLAVTELIANAIKHANSAVHVTVVVDHAITVSVRDRGPAMSRRRAPLPMAENGRGLRIVAAVSAEWGMVEELGGKCLWFRLPLPDTTVLDADVIGIHSGSASMRRSAAAAQSLARPAEANGTDAVTRTA